MISAMLMALILGAGYACLSAAFSSQKLMEPRAEAVQNARVAMAMITADLRTACPLSKEFEFLGMHRTVDEMDADNLDFATHNYMPRRAREADFCETSYYVQKDGETGDVSLYRRRNPTIAPDALSGGSRELITRGLRGVTFEYYDGWDWYDSWGETDPKKKDQKASLLAPNISGMPEAVRVTLSFNPNRRAVRNKSADELKQNDEPAMVFETIVKLNLAAS